MNEQLLVRLTKQNRNSTFPPICSMDCSGLVVFGIDRVVPKTVSHLLILMRFGDLRYDVSQINCERLIRPEVIG